MGYIRNEILSHLIDLDLLLDEMRKDFICNAHELGTHCPDGGRRQSRVETTVVIMDEDLIE